MRAGDANACYFSLQTIISAVYFEVQRNLNTFVFSYETI